MFTGQPCSEVWKQINARVFALPDHIRYPELMSFRQHATRLSAAVAMMEHLARSHFWLVKVSSVPSSITDDMALVAACECFGLDARRVQTELKEHEREMAEVSCARA